MRSAGDSAGTFVGLRSMTDPGLGRQEGGGLQSGINAIGLPTSGRKTAEPMSEAAAARSVREEFSGGWPVLLTATMGVGLSSMHAYAIGVFIGPIQDEFGWNTDLILLGQSLITAIVGFGSLSVGRLMDKFGARPLALWGLLILAGGTASLSIVPKSLLAYLACNMAIGIGCLMASAMVWTRLVVDRFESSRGLALSISLCGSNIAGAIAPMLATVAIDLVNWRVGYLALAAYMIASALPLALFFFHDGGRPRASVKKAIPLVAAPAPIALTGPSLRRAAEIPEFWLFLVSFTLAGIAITGFIVHLVPMMTAQGLSRVLAASAVSGLSLAAIGGRLGAGVLMDRVFAPRLAATALSLPLAGILALVLIAPSYWTALCAAVLVGLSTGAEYNMISYLTARYFGLRHLGAITGLYYGVFALGSLIGLQLPLLILRRYSYQEVIILFAACFILASFAMLLCRRYPTQRELEVATGDASVSRAQS